ARVLLRRLHRQVEQASAVNEEGDITDEAVGVGDLRQQLFLHVDDEQSGVGGRHQRGVRHGAVSVAKPAVVLWRRLRPSKTEDRPEFGVPGTLLPPDVGRQRARSATLGPPPVRQLWRTYSCAQVALSRRLTAAPPYVRRHGSNQGNT